MIVSPDEISASNAPSTSPLKHCDMKLAQLIIDQNRPLAHVPRPSPRKRGPRIMALDSRLRGNERSYWRVFNSGVVAGVASESIGLLHQRRAVNHLED